MAEAAHYVTLLERMLQWSARCVANFAAVFALPLDFTAANNGNAQGQRQQQPSAQAQSARNSTPGLPNNNNADEQKQPLLAFSAPNSPVNNNAASPAAAPPPVSMHPLLNTHSEALSACVDVLARCWSTLSALAAIETAKMEAQAQAIANSAVLAGGTGAFMPPQTPIAAARALLSSTVHANHISATPLPMQFSLERYLAPHLSDAFSRLYDDLSMACARVTDGFNGGASDSLAQPGGAIVSDAHLTLLLHALLAELSWIDALAACPFASASAVNGASALLHPDALSSIARRVLVRSRFMPQAQRFIQAERVPRLITLSRQPQPHSQTPPARSSAGTPGAGGASSSSSSSSSRLSDQITALFSVYTSLAWFLYAAQPLLLSPTTRQRDTRVQARTARGWAELRKWFAAIVDGFLDGLLEEIARDVIAVASSSSNTAATATAMVAVTSPSTGAPLATLRDVMDRADFILGMLLQKPATRAHKRVLVDALGVLVMAHVETKLLQSSSAPPASSPGGNAPPAAERRVGILEELHARHYLNRLYQARYPPAGSIGSDGKPISSPPLQPAAAASSNPGSPPPDAQLFLSSSSSTPGGSSSKAVDAHLFGYDLALPRITASTVRSLNELRVANVKLEQLGRLAVGVGLATHGAAQPPPSRAADGQLPLHRGPAAKAVASLLTQTLSHLSEGLCAVVVPGTVANLVRTVSLPAGIAPGSSSNPNRWSAVRVEKCLAESLGFLYEHVEALKSFRLHVELVREIGLHIVLAFLDALAIEMRNVTRIVAGDGVVYFKRREGEKWLSKEVIAGRIGEAMKLIKAFAQDVCAVPAHWFESTIPSSSAPPTAASSGSHSMGGGGNGKPPLAQILGLGPYAPKLTGGGDFSFLRPVIPPPPPARPYVSPPAWSAVPTLLLEIWKIERLHAVLTAPSATLIALFSSAPLPSASGGRSGGGDKDSGSESSAQSDLLAMQGVLLAVEDNSDDESASGAAAAAPSHQHRRGGSAGGGAGGGGGASEENEEDPVSRVGSPSSANYAAEQQQPPAILRPQPQQRAALLPPPSLTDASAAPSSRALSVDASTPLPAGLTRASSSTPLPSLPEQGGGGGGGAQQQQQQLPLYFPSPTSVSPSASNSLVLPAPPHPCVLLALSRYDLYRVLLQRAARVSDDSLAGEWVSKLPSNQKPSVPKGDLAEVPPPSSGNGLLGKIGNFFGRGGGKDASSSSSASAAPTAAAVAAAATKKPKAKLRSTKLFASPLALVTSEWPSIHSPLLPRVADVLISFLRGTPGGGGSAMDEPGLFRIGGNKESIDRLRIEWDRAYQSNDPFLIPSLHPSNDIHEASGLLKMFYRLLPEPLIPFEFYNRFVAVGAMDKGAALAEEAKVASLRKLIQLLPPVNRATMQHLAVFLHEVTLHAAVNKMTADKSV